VPRVGRAGAIRAGRQPRCSFARNATPAVRGSPPPCPLALSMRLGGLKSPEARTGRQQSRRAIPGLLLQPRSGDNQRERWLSLAVRMPGAAGCDRAPGARKRCRRDTQRAGQGHPGLERHRVHRTGRGGWGCHDRGLPRSEITQASGIVGWGAGRQPLVHVVMSVLPSRPC
jgi:hypothetical protein